MTNQSFHVKHSVNNCEVVVLTGRKKDVHIGKNFSLKINCSVGLTQKQNYDNEITKVEKISNNDVLPDIMMDLSTVKVREPIYAVIQEKIGCPVGTVPTYVCFDEKNGIEKNKLLENIEEQAQNGVAFMTFHFTALEKLYKQSFDRNVPVVSRGGSIVLRDNHINKRTENVLLDNIDDILKILRKYDVVASVGTTYRPSTLYDALDKVHREEIEFQKNIIKYIMRKKVNIMMEGVGHISLSHLKEYVDLIRSEFYVPFMPLGPIPTDRAKGRDNISNAIGASYMAMLDGIDVINCITREEHTGGIPHIDSILEAIGSAKVVVNTIEDAKNFDEYNFRKNVKINNCMGIEQKELGCDRCGEQCPFMLNINNIINDNL